MFIIFSPTECEQKRFVLLYQGLKTQERVHKTTSLSYSPLKASACDSLCYTLGDNGSQDGITLYVYMKQRYGHTWTVKSKTVKNELLYFISDFFWSLYVTASNTLLTQTWLSRMVTTSSKSHAWVLSVIFSQASQSQWLSSHPPCLLVITYFPRTSFSKHCSILLTSHLPSSDGKREDHSCGLAAILWAFWMFSGRMKINKI